MAFASLDPAQNNTLLGEFKEKSMGHWFQYAASPHEIYAPTTKVLAPVRFPHIISVGPEGNDTRYACVMGTVAYVIIDETENGWIVEKWDIKMHSKYTA